MLTLPISDYNSSFKASMNKSVKEGKCKSTPRWPKKELKGMGSSSVFHFRTESCPFKLTLKALSKINQVEVSSKHKNTMEALLKVTVLKVIVKQPETGKD